ncbi:MAG: YjbF family lipoprotein [Roseivivax sp.]|nr:YjbF family lipoprotein [Roseivivax sp.]
MKRHLIGLLAALGALGGCGSSAISTDGSQVIRDTLKGVTAGKAAPNVVTTDQLSAELSASSAPLMLVITDATQNQALLREIARNGRDGTFATAQREALIVRDGIIVASRGLGGDMMSSVQGGLERLVRSQSNGASDVTLVFLDGADQPDRRSYSCTVSVGGQTPVVAGAVNATARIVTTTCTGPDSYSNTYLVASDGYVLGSRQWVGPTIGYLSTQALRR